MEKKKPKMAGIVQVTRFCKLI